MRLKLCILICLLLASPIGYGLTLNEDIHVYGDGRIYARTNTNDAKDQASGSGDQIYKRDLNLEDDASSLQTSYIYNNGSSIVSNISNQYSLQASSFAGSQHIISVYSNSSINSQGKIERMGNSLSTDYNITSSNGNLSESVITYQGGHSRYIAEARLEGKFDLSSQLSEKVDVSRGFDVADLLASLQSVDLKGDRGVQEDKTAKPSSYLIGGKEVSDEDNVARLVKRAKDLISSSTPDDLNEAIALCDEAINYTTGDTPYQGALIWFNKGIAQNRLTKYEDALNSFNMSISLDSTEKLAWYEKGFALTKLGRNEEAIESFERAIGIDSNYEDALYAKGKLLFDGKKYNESSEILDKLLELSPDDEGALKLKHEINTILGK